MEIRQLKYDADRQRLAREQVEGDMTIDNNHMIDIKTTHFGPRPQIQWDKTRKYMGTEAEGQQRGWQRYLTFKPGGVYLGFNNEYIDYFYGLDSEEAIRSAIEDSGNNIMENIFNRLYKDMKDQRQWSFRHEVTVRIKPSEIYIVKSIDDLPCKDFNHAAVSFDAELQRDRIALRYKDENGKIPEGTDIEAVSKVIEDELVQYMKNRYPEYWDAWYEIQTKYKAMYIHPDFFDNNDDIYDFHMRQLILFDTSCIVEDLTKADMFDFASYVFEKLPEFDRYFPSDAERDYWLSDLRHHYYKYTAAGLYNWDVDWAQENYKAYDSDKAVILPAHHMTDRLHKLWEEQEPVTNFEEASDNGFRLIRKDRNA